MPTAPSTSARWAGTRIQPGETKTFDLTYRLLRNGEEVKQALAQVEKIQAGRPTELREQPWSSCPEWQTDSKKPLHERLFHAR